MTTAQPGMALGDLYGNFAAQSQWLAGELAKTEKYVRGELRRRQLSAAVQSALATAALCRSLEQEARRQS